MAMQNLSHRDPGAYIGVNALTLKGVGPKYDHAVVLGSIDKVGFTSPVIYC
jgi:hypothetical protein